MADELKRYSPAGSAVMQEMTGGKYVKFEDYDALRAEVAKCHKAYGNLFNENAALQGEIDTLRVESIRLHDQLKASNRLIVRYIEEENGALKTARNEVISLKARLAKFEGEPMVPLRMVEDVRLAMDAPMEPGLRSATIREIAEHQTRIIDSCRVALDAAIRAAIEGE